MSLRLRKAKTWPYASSSTGRPRGSLPLRRLGLRTQVYEAIGEARQVYIDQISNEVVGHINENASEIRISGSCVDLSLFMVGNSPERTKPIVMIVSQDKNARLEAFRLVNESGIMDRYPGFDLGHMPLKTEFENLCPLGGASELSCSQKSLSPVSNELRPDAFAARDGSTMHGRRLEIPGRGSSHGSTRLATVGGIVEFQGRFYAHSVQHSFTPTTIACPSPCSPSVPDRNSDDEWDATGMSDFDDDEDTEATSRGSQTPDSTRSSTSLDSEPFGSSFFVDGNGSAVSLIRIADKLQRHADLEEPSRADGNNRTDSKKPKFTSALPPEDLVCVGHPAFALNSDVYDSVFIHIGIDVAAELGVTETKLRQGAIPLEELDEHIEVSPRDTAIQATTPDGGTVTGTLSGTPSFLRLPNALEFLEVYVAKMDVPLAVGDCGSWIRDMATGKIFGHVVAGSPTTGLTIVMPANKSFLYARDALKQAGIGPAQRRASRTSEDPRNSLPPFSILQLHAVGRKETNTGSSVPERHGAILASFLDAHHALDPTLAQNCPVSVVVKETEANPPYIDVLQDYGEVDYPDEESDDDSGGDEPVETNQALWSSVRRLSKGLRETDDPSPDPYQDAQVVKFVEYGLKTSPVLSKGNDQTLVALVADQIDAVGGHQSRGGLIRSRLREQLGNPVRVPP